MLFASEPDAILDAMLAQDSESRVAVETLVTTGLAVISGEVRTNAYVDVQEIVRGVIREIGYTKASYRFDADSCGVLSAIHQQSADIAMGVDEGDDKAQGAGDQGMMYGYAHSPLRLGTDENGTTTGSSIASSWWCRGTAAKAKNSSIPSLTDCGIADGRYTQLPHKQWQPRLLTDA